MPSLTVRPLEIPQCPDIVSNHHLFKMMGSIAPNVQKLLRLLCFSKLPGIKRSSLSFHDRISNSDSRSNIKHEREKPRESFRRSNS